MTSSHRPGRRTAMANEIGINIHLILPLRRRNAFNGSSGASEKSPAAVGPALAAVAQPNVARACEHPRSACGDIGGANAAHSASTTGFQPVAAVTETPIEALVPLARCTKS